MKYLARYLARRALGRPDVLYIHIPKTGGTYIGQYESDAKPVIWPVQTLGHVCVVADDPSRRGAYPPREGLSVTRPKGVLRYHFVMATVRNIFDWLVSYAGHAGAWDTKYLNTSHYDYVHAQKGFEYLVRTLAGRDDIWPCRKFIHFQLFCEDGDLMADWINRTETLDDDLRELALLKGLQYVKKEKQRIGTGRRDYRSYYTDALVELVYQTWGRELDLFGYGFDGLDMDKAVLKRHIDKGTKKRVKYFWADDRLVL